MKMTKRIISALLAVVMLLGMVPMTAVQAAESEATETVAATVEPQALADEGIMSLSGEASGTCGENLIWTLADGILTISGTGIMENYVYDYYSDPPWHSSRASIHTVVIQEGVTSIGYFAFSECNNLTSVIIPEGVTYVGRGAFDECTSLTNVRIPDSVTYIGGRAFEDCHSLTSMIIPRSVTSVGPGTFADCIGLTSVTIPESVTSIGEESFSNCVSLTNVIIPRSVTDIYSNAFADCISLASITIPSSVTRIEDYAFLSCDSLASVTIPDSVALIGRGAFSGCSSLTDVYYSGTAEMWNTISMGLFNDCLTNATVHYNWASDGSSNNSNFSIPGLSINNFDENFYIFLGDPHVYNMYQPDSPTYSELSVTLSWDGGTSPRDITWTSSDESVVKVVSEGVSYENALPRFEGVNTGTAVLTATNQDGDSLSFDVTVVNPNTLEFTNIYDSIQYYESGAFYSAASSISDSVEILLQFANKRIEAYPCGIEEEMVDRLSLEPITLTAVVSGNDLSFDRDTYQNTFTATYEGIAFETAVYDLLTLFPSNIDAFCNESAAYSVEITLASDSFEAPIIETYNFTVVDAELLRADEHIGFITTNNAYILSKQNNYGRSMVALKGDAEYQWSRWSTFDFENYYEVVMADLLIGMLDAPQTGSSIIQEMLKEWYGNYSTILDGVDTIVDESYADVFDISEIKIDKILKVSKYDTDGIYVDDELYQAVFDTFGNVGNAEKIQTLFARIDKTTQVAGYVNLAGNVIQDFIAWGNTVAVMNAFKGADKELQKVFRSLADSIPDSERKMKEAVEDYLNYSHDHSGFVTELYETIVGLRINVGLDTFSSVVGKKAWDYFALKAVGWIGNISINGAKLSSTAVFSTITSATSQAIAGATLTGVTLGLCVSDLICNSGDKAAEMGKLIAMSEYAPYIIHTLESYEANLRAHRSDDVVILFENAFHLHQATQSYIMDHTVKALEAKADSILQSILGNQEYYKIAATTLANKRVIDNMECCGSLAAESAVVETKVIAIKCPVDVYFYDGQGNEVVRIINNTTEFVSDELDIYIRDGEKFIAVPADQEYYVKIIATDVGTMDYLAMEFNEMLELTRTLVTENIPLIRERVFEGAIPEAQGMSNEEYALTWEENSVIPGGSPVPDTIDITGTYTTDLVMPAADLGVSAPDSVLRATLTFGEDGTASCVWEAVDLTAFRIFFHDMFVNAYYAMAYGAGITDLAEIEQFCMESTGMSVSDYMDTLVTDQAMIESFTPASTSGTYSYNADHSAILTDLAIMDVASDPTIENSFVLGGGTLYLTAASWDKPDYTFVCTAQ